MAKTHRTTRLTIAGTPVNVTHEEVPLTSLRLDPDNPRIRLQTSAVGRKKLSTHEQLLELMRAQPGYDALHRQIRDQGGVHEALIVRHDGRIVEGNTRFAVLSVLAKTPGGREKWGTVPVTRLPVEVSEKVIQLQMAGYHVSGKTKWRAAAQAGQIYRLVEESEATIEEVAAATRMTPKRIQQNIEAYRYLIDEVIPELKGAGSTEKQEILDNRFSHALELMTRRDLEPVRQDKTTRRKVAKLIAEGKIKGAQVRKLPTVLKHSRASEALERDGFDAAREVLRKVDPAAESTVLKSVEKLTEMLKTLDQKDLELFRTNDKARDALQALMEAAENVRTMTLPRGKRRA